MSDYEELFRRCLYLKNNDAEYNKHLKEFCLIPEVREMIKDFQITYGLDEDDIKERIGEELRFQKRVLKLSTLRNYIRLNDMPTLRERNKEKNDKEKQRLAYCDYFIEKFNKHNTPDKFREIGKNKGLYIINKIFSIVDEERVDGKEFLNNLITKSGLEFENKQSVIHIIKTFQKFDSTIMNAVVNKLLTFSEYTKLIEYIIKHPKVNISDLIVDFNKVRDYLSILLNDNPRTKEEFVQMCHWKEVSSYEKEVYRISALFEISKGKFIESKKELEKSKPDDFSKIYDIHNIPDIAVNFMILDILQTKKNFKLKDIMAELSPHIENEIKLNKIFKANDKILKKEDPVTTFRKYTILPRINKMVEYGFVSVDKNNKYGYNFKAKFLNNKQKQALKYVVPFFCGTYPFASIGHFLAGRLDIDDKFNLEPYNIANILDDCITYNLLEAINNKKTVNIILKGKEDSIKLTPTELYIEKNKKGLLKVKDNKHEYYLHEIGGFENDKSLKTEKNRKLYNIDSPIFSEIYSFYYKIFEDAVKKYKKDKAEGNLKKERIYDEYFPKKYNAYKRIFHQNTFNDLLPILANLKHDIAIPLTTLELRWLKTIMQDPRFDLFVTDEEKSCLANLVEDVDIIDLSAFKIYDNKSKAYKSINTVDIPKGTERNTFRAKLEKLKTVLYLTNENSFPDLL